MKVRDDLGDPCGGAVWVGDTSEKSGTGRGPLGWSGMGRWTLREVQDGSGDPTEGSGQGWKTSGMSGMGRGTLGKIRDGSMDHRGGPGLVG